MTILIEAEAKEIAELLTLLTPKERQIVKLEIWDGANWGRRKRSTNTDSDNAVREQGKCRSSYTY